jgi:hypothetical protein
MLAPISARPALTPLRTVRLYKQQWDDMMRSDSESISPLLDYEQPSVGTTWKLSFKAIEARSRNAANLLRLWAFVDNKDWVRDDRRALLSSYWSWDWRRLVGGALLFPVAVVAWTATHCFARSPSWRYLPAFFLPLSAASFWLEPSVVFRYTYLKPYLCRLRSSVSAVVSCTLPLPVLISCTLWTICSRDVGLSAPI